MSKRIYLKGVIVSDDEQWIYDWLNINAVSPNVINQVLTDAKNEPIELWINSGGGSVQAGSEIYTILKEYEGRSVGKIIGQACSIASVIAMGVDKLYMSPTSQIMIHNVSMSTQGDYRVLEHGAKMLKQYNDTLANAYYLKSGMSKGDLKKLMDSETWITPEQALDYKLIDGILFTDTGDTERQEAQAKLDMLNGNNKSNQSEEQEKQQIQLNYLKLKVKQRGE